MSLPANSSRSRDQPGGPVDSAIELVLAKFPSAKKSGSGWMARCKAHDDQEASLKIDVDRRAESLSSVMPAAPSALSLMPPA